MNKKYPSIIFILFLIFNFNSGFSADSAKEKIFASFIIQNEGRHKPLDTFARNTLLSVHQSSKIKKDKLSAISWLTQLIFDSENAYEKKHFKIREPEVLEALKITPRLDHLYSFIELRDGVNKIMDDIQKWFQLKNADRSLAQNQILRLYRVLGNYYQLSRSFSLFIEDISVDNKSLAEDFGLKVGQKVSYIHFYKRSDFLRKQVSRINALEEKDRSERDESLFRLISLLSERSRDQASTQLSIIPSSPDSNIEQWSSPWKLMGEKSLDEWTWKRMDELQQFYSAMKNSDYKNAEIHANALKKTVGHREYTQLELNYSKADLFTYSMVFYLLAFISLLISWMVLKKPLYWCAFSSLTVGILLHGTGLIMRMVIMGRPPVSTLYESIIFVGFISALLCFILEVVRRNGLGIFCATVLGVLLHFVGFSYAADGDTMGMLVAVLDSNFWLATHVVTITMGYGITFVAGILGHLYLLKAIFKPNDKKSLSEIYKNSIGLSLVALLFTTLGTILGGIWADQSWGRFWGWDPKENGALLIVLWLLMLLHGRIAGKLKPLGFSAGLVLSNIIVALAWFGVNLLNVGLHNYGFTESIAYNLSVFCGIEAIFALVGYFWASKKLSV